MYVEITGKWTEERNQNIYSHRYFGIFLICLWIMISGKNCVKVDRPQ